MPSALRISDTQRRARLGRRHFLESGHVATDPVELARGLVALHASDPATVHLSAAARRRTASVAEMEDALYEERTLIRMLGMRRTLFVVPVDFAAVVQASSTDAIAVTLRRRLLKALADAGAGDDAWLTKVESATCDALAGLGHATGAQVSSVEPLLQTKLRTNVGKKYEAVGNITTYVLTLLAAEGRIVRGRPRGSWLSSQYVWWPIEAWLPHGIPAMPADEARVELVRSWLAAFGPGTVADIHWWTGWPLGHVRRAIAALDIVSVVLDGGDTGLVLAADTEPVDQPEPWVALLPGLDPTVMGWKQRDWYLGPYKRQLFDTAGNAGRTVWCGGRIVGGWAQRRDGEVVVRLLEDVGREARAAVASAADDMRAWLGAARITGRFPSPLERGLVG